MATVEDSNAYECSKDGLELGKLFTRTFSCITDLRSKVDQFTNMLQSYEQIVSYRKSYELQKVPLYGNCNCQLIFSALLLC